MLEFRTAGFNPYAVKYSPYYDSRIAVASAANYGIVGNGRVFCLALGPQGIQVERTYVLGCPLPPPSRSSLPVEQATEEMLLAYPANVLGFPATPPATASTPTMRSMTWRGPRSTRTNCSWPAAMVPSSCTT